MPDYVEREELKVDATLARFVETEALPGLGLTHTAFWAGLAELVTRFGPLTRHALNERQRMQEELDAFYKSHRGNPIDFETHRGKLEEIGYLVEEGDDFTIETEGVDPEISHISGPQLVVPATNARYALNAANARWGSLYDALYGTDVLGDLPPEGGYDTARGRRVIERSKAFLDDIAPLVNGSHADVTGYSIGKGGRLQAEFLNGSDWRGTQTTQSREVPSSGHAPEVKHGTPLADPNQFVGYGGDRDAPSAIVLRKHNLHVVVQIDRDDPVGADDDAGIRDIMVEAAISTIVDCEDSVACVDGADKAHAYRNWLGLMKGDLTEFVVKGGQSTERRLADDLIFTARDGGELELKGRALLLIRNVGHLMTTPAVLGADGDEIGEGLLDALCTVMIAMHDRQRPRTLRNSTTGAVYVVKPKMHGPEEVELTDQIFAAVEDILGLPRNTVKMGIMDEERRTSVNLKECIRAAKSRVAFINTGFLDRTGDEIHTAMEAGPMLRKGEMKETPWLRAYEDRNVDIGLACGFKGRAQIGKGMWAKPAKMAEMLEQKIGHPEAGASCAWVPSPTAAVLHATHYHRVSVLAKQGEIGVGGPRGTLKDLLTLPVMRGQNLSGEEVTAEVENNAQGILGYVVRWVDQGVGCSTVPDINDVGLMEDRATCRISSQALANWLHHGVASKKEVRGAMERMAEKVDRQNEGDPGYIPMAPDFDGPAFAAACDLVFEGRAQPSGYTEPTLHRRRAEAKARRHEGAAEAGE